MNVNEMTKGQIEARLAEIMSEIEKRSDEKELSDLKAEVVELQQRKAEIEAFELRNQQANDLQSGAAAPDKIIQRKEERKMERTFAIDSIEYRAAWLKSLQGKELDVEERAAVSASAAIPTQTMNKIVGKLELCPIINAVDLTYIPGNVVIPVEGTTADANWVAMGTAATDSADTLGQVTLGAYKLIKTVEITADVEKMAIDAFEDWLVSRLANKIERAVAKAIVVGTGSAQATGLNTLTKTADYTKAGITYSDVMAIIAALGSEFCAGASFVMSRETFYKNVLNIQDTAKHPIVVADVQAPAKFNILGYPVIIEDEAGSDIFFGDLKQGYKFNFAKAPVVSADDSVAFRTGSRVYRALALADGKPTGVGVVRFCKSAT